MNKVILMGRLTRHPDVRHSTDQGFFDKINKCLLTGLRSTVRTSCRVECNLGFAVRTCFRGRRFCFLFLLKLGNGSIHRFYKNKHNKCRNKNSSLLIMNCLFDYYISKQVCP